MSLRELQSRRRNRWPAAGQPARLLSPPSAPSPPQSLRLQALMSECVERHLAGYCSLETTACCLFALTVKSCRAPGKLGCAPISAYELINRRHQHLMPQL